MHFNEFKKLVDALNVGKRLPDAVYLHQSYICAVPGPLAEFIAAIAKEHGDQFDWNIVKLYRRDYKVALLAYPDFDVLSYPPLSASLTIDLVRSIVRQTNFHNSDNPPILHRKETLVPKTYPLFARFAELTREGEEAGLYKYSRKIGFKKPWEQTIAKNGYALRNGRLVRLKSGAEASLNGEPSAIEIQRHLTAVDRDKLSTPLQSLARHGYLDGEYSLLDYGCGKGHDLLELEAHGIDAIGWDPSYRPNGNKRNSDIVNMGFVINVIEDLDERSNALTEAFSLANQLLVVAVMLGGQGTTKHYSPYKDGIVTSRGTFQKYYTQAELRSLLESTLNTPAVAVGPGLYYMFKDKLDEQKFLASRQRARREWKQLVRRDKRCVNLDQQVLIENNLALFKDFWESCLGFGRSPANDEFERSNELRRIIGSHKRAARACMAYFGEDDFEAARKGRKKDLTVFLALRFFDRNRIYTRMPISIQRDIRSFFETPSSAYSFAKCALFSIADTEMIAEACKNAYFKLNCGLFRPGESFTLLSSLVNELPPILRIYVGCAAQLYGDLDQIDLVKVHILSGKVSLMKYNNFDGLLPTLRERVKVRLRDQEIDYFTHAPSDNLEPLYYRSQYSKESCRTCRQLEFEERLREFGINLGDYGPSLQDLYRHAERRGITLLEEDRA